MIVLCAGSRLTRCGVDRGVEAGAEHVWKSCRASAGADPNLPRERLLYSRTGHEHRSRHLRCGICGAQAREPGLPGLTTRPRFTRRHAHGLDDLAGAGARRVPGCRRDWCVSGRPEHIGDSETGIVIAAESASPSCAIVLSCYALADDVDQADSLIRRRCRSLRRTSPTHHSQPYGNCSRRCSWTMSSCEPTRRQVH